MAACAHDAASCSVEFGEGAPPGDIESDLRSWAEVPMERGVGRLPARGSPGACSAAQGLIWCAPEAVHLLRLAVRPGRVERPPEGSNFPVAGDSRACCQKGASPALRPSSPPLVIAPPPRFLPLRIGFRRPSARSPAFGKFAKHGSIGMARRGGSGFGTLKPSRLPAGWCASTGGRASSATEGRPRGGGRLGRTAGLVLD